MADEIILSLSADIITAHVSHNSVPAGDLPTLIRSVFGALATLGQDAPVAEEPRKPAVSVRASVKSDVLVCLDCGAKMKMLKRHLLKDHGLTPAEYRARWALPADYPMVAADYAARRKELALSIGLGRKPKVAPAQVAEPVQEALSTPEPARKAPVKRKAAAKPKSSRKTLKVAFDAVDVPQAEATVADADTQG